MDRYAGAAIAAAALLALAVAAGRCASSGGEADGKLDPRLRRLAAERPDSVVGVLVRTAAGLGPAEREALAEHGLAIGSVAGDVVTGRILAGAAPGLARLRFVVYVEAAARLRPAEARPRSVEAG